MFLALVRGRGTRVFVAVVAAFLCAVAPAAAAAEDSRSRLAWIPCFEGLECATVPVPLDYDNPRGAKIPIALTRLPASDPRRRIGSLFLNPGGPGGSGVEFLVGLGAILGTDELRARFDLIGFDPRGILRSAPLRCFDSPEQWEPFFTPFPFPLTREQEREWIAADRYLTSACSHRGGRIIDHMSTANVARDLDVMRAAVGDSKLSYWGFSYGSYLGNTYANLFPGRVRAVVIDGVLDPIAWSTGRGVEGRLVPFSTRLRSDVGAQATLEEFFRLCDAGGDACAFSGDAAERFAALAAQLRREPIEVTFPDGTTGPLDYANLIGTTLGAMYDSLSWGDFAQFLADIEAQAQGSARTATRVRLKWTRPWPPYVPRASAPPFPEEPEYPNFVEGFPGVACSDSDNPSSYAAWSIAGALSDARFGYFGRIWTWASSICAEWPGADRDRYMGPFNRATANPVLVVGNRFDPATAYHGARIADDLLPRSALLTINGWGHTSLFLSQCADAAISRYLIHIATPPRGATCDPNEVPFSGE